MSANNVLAFGIFKVSWVKYKRVYIGAFLCECIALLLIIISIFYSEISLDVFARGHGL